MMINIARGITSQRAFSKSPNLLCTSTSLSSSSPHFSTNFTKNTSNYANFASISKFIPKNQTKKCKNASTMHTFENKIRMNGKEERREYAVEKKRKGEGNSGVIICTAKGISKTLPDRRKLLSNVNVALFYGAKIGVVGINGSGKSTFMKILAGEDDDYEGEVAIPEQYKVGYLHQEPDLDFDKTVRENVLEGIEDKLEYLQEYETLLAKSKESSKKDPKLERKLALMEKEIREKQLKNIKHRIEKAMNALNCPDPDSSVHHLSGGEKRRVALCRLLVSQPDMLILDEPTNHLDADSVAWLEKYLDGYPGTIIAVTHDRYFLDNVAAYILEFDRGRGIPFKGNYSEWIEAKGKRLELEKKSEKQHEKLLQRELEWIRTGRRTTKNKARIERYQELSNKPILEAASPGRIVIPPGPRLGGTVLEVKNLTHSFDGRVLFRNLSFSIPSGAIVGIIGANGTGKSTLFRILTNELTPDEGTFSYGPTVRLGYITQSRELNEGNTVYQEISEGKEVIPYGNIALETRIFVASFNFRGSDQQKLVSALSGGERNRVHLAKMVKSAPNVLLLDEPTNDLDVEVLRSLESGIEEFTGSAIIVSHDRCFLDRLCTHIIAFEGDEKVVFFDGNYTEYAADFKKRNGSSEPKRFKTLGF